MKAFSLILLAAASSVQAEEWVNFVRQNQINGVVWDMPVQPVGGSESHLALQEDGALFQLWTINQGDGQDYLLDQKLVGAYLPSGEITIETGDPYTKIARTRADQPFKVHVDVSGLLSGIDLPEASTKVLLEHHLAPYAEGASSVDPAAAISGTPVISTHLSENRIFTLDFDASRLPAGDPTKALGEEHFVLHALADASVPQTQLASNFVQIWPVASGAIEGIQNGERVRGGTVPDLILHLEDLYPSSTTYLQIYPGSPNLGTIGEQVDGSVLVLDQAHGDDRVLVLEDWDHALGEDGPYTMEIITVTPFGTERLTHTQFQLDRVLSVNSQLSTLEP